MSNLDTFKKGLVVKERKIKHLPMIIINLNKFPCSMKKNVSKKILKIHYLEKKGSLFASIHAFIYIFQCLFQ